VAIISVKTGSFLMAVKRVIGGVEIDDYLFGFFRNGLHCLRDDEVLNRARVCHDFFVTGIGSLCGKFEPVEGGVGGQGLASVLGIASLFSFQIFFADGQGESWIAAEVIVIIEILVA